MPWVNFAAGGNALQFAAGGHVTGQGAEAARLVRLTSADGTAIEDTTDDGVVLFSASPDVRFPARVEILGTAGNVLAEYEEFAEFADPGYHPATRRVAGGSFTPRLSQNRA